MSDPKRILDDPTASPMGAALLADAVEAGPTASEVDATWASLSLRIAAPDNAATPERELAESGSGLRPSGMTAAAKAAALLAVIGAVAIGAPGMRRRVGSPPAQGSAPASSAREATSSIEPSDPGAPTATEISGVPTSAPVGSIGPRGPRRKPAVTDASAALLRAETTLVLRARRAIRTGDCDAAAGALEEGERSFARGILAEEREALAVEALACAGRGVEAAERAQAFLRAHPASMHAAGVRRFVP